MQQTAMATDTAVNGIDVQALMTMIEAIKADPGTGKVGFKVASDWGGQTRSTAGVSAYTLGGETIERRFTIESDEPFELLGTNAAPNPQELLMAALNACVTVGYVAGCAVNGITIEKLTIETEGELDLRGFLGIDEAVKPGYDAIRMTVTIKGDGTPEQFREVHETVMKTSPNFFNVTRPVPIDADFVVDA